MRTKNMSLTEFSKEVSDISEKYNVDISQLLGTHGASPVRVHYITDKIVVFDTCPEGIILFSGESQICIGQIQKIVKKIDGCGIISYKIHCGNSEWLKTTVTIAEY